jgi:phosphopantothenoylcysteine decarboxylase/phosphopantothenate--cysteine ligase
LANPLQNKKVLVTAGPTREYWDPVRFLSNASSGATGIALAEEAARLGARVTLILGPVRDGATRRSSIRVIPVVSAWDMYNEVKKNLAATDYFIGAAAVVDYRPAVRLTRKFKRHEPAHTLRLHGNPDIIAMVGHLRANRPACVVGFALETDNVIENAAGKMTRKHMDWIFANRETNIGEAIAEGTLLSRWGDHIALKKMSKEKLAAKLWQTILSNN